MWTFSPKSAMLKFEFSSLSSHHKTQPQPSRENHEYKFSEGVDRKTSKGLLETFTFGEVI
jgi:hypothetical protein